MLTHDSQYEGSESGAPSVVASVSVQDLGIGPSASLAGPPPDSVMESTVLKSPKPKIPKQTKEKKKKTKIAKKKAGAKKVEKPEVVAADVPEGVPPELEPAEQVAVEQEQEQEEEEDQLVEVTVPEGATAGDLMSLALEDGTEFEVEVPEGLHQGDSFEVYAPASDAGGPSGPSESGSPTRSGGGGAAADENEDADFAAAEAEAEAETAEFGTVSVGLKVEIEARGWEVVEVLVPDGEEGEVVRMRAVGGGGATKQLPLAEVSAAVKRTLQWDATSQRAAPEPAAAASRGRPMAAEAAPTTSEAPASGTELPEGWTSGKLGNGTEFWFRIHCPSQVSWSFPTGDA